MADLAEPIDDLICTFEGIQDLTMDTLAMLVFGWILIALLILWLGKFIYSRFVLKKQTKPITDNTISAKLKSESIRGDENSVLSNSGTNEEKTVKKSVNSVSGGAGGGGGGYVPPTPPVRKRLSRKSPGPDLKRSTFYIPAPQCTGADHISVLWVNDIFQWLYNDLVIVNEILNIWIQSLNEFTKQSVSEHGIGVEFIRILPETKPPTLSNVFCECASNDDVTITCDCEATPALQVKCFRQKGDKIDTSHYRVNVNRFRGRLNIFCVTEKMQADMKCDGWPEIKVSLAQVGNIKNNLDETQLQDLIIEVIVNALRNTQVHLDLTQYLTCPRLIRHIGTPGHTFPHYDSMLGVPYTSTPNHRGIGGEKRLLVKIVRASQLGATQGCKEPFCIVEMDEPPQKNQTSVKKDTSSPDWDEHFLFDLSPNTAELLFEVYDRAVKPHRFLGLGIVGVEELLINPSQRQIISLQSRPYECDTVSGTITVEFLFIEGADIPLLGDRPFKLKETLRTVSPTGALITTTKTTFKNGESFVNGGNLTDSAIKELERSRQGANTNKSTLIIHSVQRQPSQRLKVELVEGAWKEIPSEPEVDAEDKSGDIQFQPQSNSTGMNLLTNNNNGNDLGQPRGRPRKKRDFFGTIKRRLGRSKTRSRSAGPGENEFDTENGVTRSISADRARDANESNSLRLNVPGLRSMDENSRRSSLSEASGLSGASTRTYVNEASTLVLETLENGVKKHYLVPLSLAQKSKWRKKGTKLHIFNDHTFIAKHLPGGTICQVCSKSIARRLGKQGYECRDCLLKCHKHCHVKCNDNCPTSTIHNIELSYITNPYTDKNIRML